MITFSANVPLLNASHNSNVHTCFVVCLTSVSSLFFLLSFLFVSKVILANSVVNLDRDG